jgi:TRAP-type mannitol/chloroaromatic compound transport system permease small subunit
VKNEGHIFVELFTKNLSAKNILRLDIFAMMATLVYVAIMSWKTLESAIEQTLIREQAESALGYLAVWPSRWFVVIGFVCFLLQLIAQIMLYMARTSSEEDNTVKPASNASGGDAP